MKIIAYSTARTTWLFPLEEIAPLSGTNGINLIAEIGARYEFRHIPTLTTADDMQKNGLKFGLGKFREAETVKAITELSVYSDGLVATTEQTDTGHAILTDLVSWLRAEYEFRDFSSQVKEVFLSEITIEFDYPLDRLIPAFETITKLVSKFAGRDYQTRDSMGFARFDLEFDRTSPNVKMAAPRFLIERRANASFDQERYFCSAPIRTQEHLEVLSQIESLLEKA